MVVTPAVRPLRAVAALVFAGAPAFAQTGIPAAVRDNAAARVREGITPSIVIVVSDSGRQTMFATGTTVAGGGSPVDVNTVYEIGSITKAFTGLLLADMVRRGEVALDDPVQRYLPAGVTMPKRGDREITLRDLATQTSALPRMPGNFAPADPANPYADYSVDSMYAFLGRYTLPRDIGSQYEYSNLGVGLLGHVLARRAGKDYEALVRERVLVPLGMTSTAVTLTPAMRGRLARGHSGGRPVANWDLPTLPGAGALRSTATDMVRFLAANMDTLSVPLGAAAAVATRDDPAIPGPVGLGWHVAAGAVPFVWHNGGTGGYRSFAGFDRARRRAVVVFVNSDVSADDIGRTLLDPSLPLAPVRAAVAVDTAVLQRYVGEYQLAPTFVMTVRYRDGGLTVQATGQPELQLFAESETMFFLRVVDARLEFERDSAGTAVAVTLHQSGRSQRAARR